MKKLESPFTLGLRSREIPLSYKRIPAIGRILWFFNRPTKWRAYLNCIKEQIMDRCSFDSDIWPSDSQKKIAAKIEDILAEQCWGETLRFHPDDLYYIIGECEVGDLSEVEAIMEIEDYFNINFPEEWNLFGKPISFGQVVSYIDKTANKTVEQSP